MYVVILVEMSYGLIILYLDYEKSIISTIKLQAGINYISKYKLNCVINLLINILTCRISKNKIEFAQFKSVSFEVL